MCEGSCQCGRTRFGVDAGDMQAVMECNRSHCQCKGYLLWFLPRTALSTESGVMRFPLARSISTSSSPSFARPVDALSGCPIAINVRCQECIELAGLPSQAIDGRSL
ncbi:hypothetical protein [Solilutibacter pythonis]|uniref:hypothetical protein n=1 Tax=Solilutibacter pythonis TaxID=2483112 RepID=UPI001B873686|nr:hypothetical protein [Lysobacter pythonis]